MIDVNEILAQFSEQQVAGFLLVLGRISPLFLLAPLFSNKLIPARAKTIIAVALAVGIWPIAAHAGTRHHIDLDALPFAALMLKEVLVGVVFALVLAALTAALATAGSLADTIIGFSFGSLVDPVSGNNSSLLSNLYSMLAIAVFVAIGGDSWVIQGLARTYDVVPLLASPSIATATQGVQVAFSGILPAALMVAAPVLLAVILTDAALGVVTRVVPSLNVFSIGFPAKIAVGLTVMAASLPFVAGWVGDQLQQSVSAALHSLKVA
ncbi:flagellar biosynthetic protein FliR [Candidatus Solirubrobacter pratensis]|uniref:flagellar biosynthetic protein FliR n=1 Tax=Candidatus Solirubrobacter pratensis TaxID=1298857 RepID=UPI000419D2EE|nr:flagellar biosynthetic protein FliR [Candidatus Solirubrobacter pratensis]